MMKNNRIKLLAYCLILLCLVYSSYALDNRLKLCPDETLCTLEEAVFCGSGSRCKLVEGQTYYVRVDGTTNVMSYSYNPSAIPFDFTGSSLNKANGYLRIKVPMVSNPQNFTITVTRTLGPATGYFEIMDLIAPPHECYSFGGLSCGNISARNVMTYVASNDGYDTSAELGYGYDIGSGNPLNIRISGSGTFYIGPDPFMTPFINISSNYAGFGVDSFETENLTLDSSILLDSGHVTSTDGMVDINSSLTIENDLSTVAGSLNLLDYVAIHAGLSVAGNSDLGFLQTIGGDVISLSEDINTSHNIDLSVVGNGVLTLGGSPRTSWPGPDSMNIENYVKHVGFETGDSNLWSATGGATATIVTDSYHGDYALSVNSGSAGNVQTSLSNIFPNTVYAITAWVKPLTPNADVYLDINCVDSLSSPSPIVSPNTPSTASDLNRWERIYYVIETSADVAYCSLSVRSALNANFVLDSIQVEPNDITVFKPMSLDMYGDAAFNNLNVSTIDVGGFIQAYSMFVSSSTNEGVGIVSSSDIFAGNFTGKLNLDRACDSFSNKVRGTSDGGFELSFGNNSQLCGIGEQCTINSHCSSNNCINYKCVS